MTTSVILTTYRNPTALAAALEGYAVQDVDDFELVVADDGSGVETERLVAGWRGPAGQPAVHVWQEDRGFRKTEILNRAILAASGDYLIFSDGDCVPRNDFVRAHRTLATAGRYLSGGYIKLSREITEGLAPEDVRSGSVFDPAWLRERGWRDGKRFPRLTRSRALASLLDRTTTTRSTWNGHNASGWRADVESVNGFDLDMGYGGLDRALGERLDNLGVRGKQVRYRAVCLHLWHPRPYLDAETIRRNREIREGIRTGGQVRAPRGLIETVPAKARHGETEPGPGGPTGSQRARSDV